MEKEEEEKEEKHVCVMCLDTLKTSELVQFIPCKHPFCHDCYLLHQVNICPVHKGIVEFIKFGNEEPIKMIDLYVSEQFYLDCLAVYRTTIIKFLEFLSTHFPDLFKFPSIRKQIIMSNQLQRSQGLKDMWKFIAAEIMPIKQLINKNNWSESKNVGVPFTKFKQLKELEQIFEIIYQAKFWIFYRHELCVFVKLEIINIANLLEDVTVLDEIFDKHEGKCITCGTADKLRPNTSCNHSICSRCIKLSNSTLPVNCPIHHVEL